MMMCNGQLDDTFRCTCRTHQEMIGNGFEQVMANLQQSTTSFLFTSPIPFFIVLSVSLDTNRERAGKTNLKPVRD